MDQQTLLILLTAFVFIAAVALVVQMGTLLAMFLAIRRLETLVMGVWPETEKIVAASRRITESVEVHVKEIGAASTAIVGITKQQAAKIDELLSDAATRAKVQMERAEMVLDDTMGRTQETVSIVQRTVLRPIREINGVLAGVKTGIAHLSRSSRPTVDHATSDEEMFI